MRFTSRIATIVYANYTENVDMNNDYFKQSELDELIKFDKSIIRVDYYVKGNLIGNKVYTEKQSIAQILKMNLTQAKIQENIEYEFGGDWYAISERNKIKEKRIQELNNKISIYKNFITEEGFNNSMLPVMLCCTFDDFIN